MLTVDDYGTIRRAHRDGMSIRAIAKAFGHSRRKVRDALLQPQPSPYTRRQPRPAPVLGPFHNAIDAILAEDELAPPKQRHTAMQVFRRLQQDHSYTGGYDQVRRYLGKKRRDRRETFIPLAHDPGQRLEADFGHIHVDFPDGRRLVAVLVCAWSYSNYPFALATPSERTEAILAGMVEAFRFFDCVPREVWWDNPRTVVHKIFKGRERRPSERYAALSSHYAFEPLFCMPARGNEKPYAETRVRVLQRQWSTPVPRAADLGALNAHLRERCAAEADRTVQGYEESIGQRFLKDRGQALPLPKHPFDACVMQQAQVDKYQTVHFDNNRYSVPRGCAFQAAAGSFGPRAGAFALAVTRIVRPAAAGPGGAPRADAGGAAVHPRAATAGRASPAARAAGRRRRPGQGRGAGRTHPRRRAASGRGGTGEDAHPGGDAGVSGVRDAPGSVPGAQAGPGSFRSVTFTRGKGR
jgi:transposase